MTTQNPTRRNVAKAAIWSVPVVTVAGSSPAMAASCDPTTNVVTRSVELTFSSSGSIFDNPSSASITYVNNGPDALIAGSVLIFSFVGSYDSTTSTPTTDPQVLPSSATISYSGSAVSDARYEFSYRVVLGADLAAGQSVAINLNTTGFGTETSAPPADSGYTGSETVYSPADNSTSPQEVVSGCETVRTVITVS